MSLNSARNALFNDSIKCLLLKSVVFPKDSEAAGPSKRRKAGKSKRKAQKANGSKNPVPENEPDGVYPGAFKERESPD